MWARHQVHCTVISMSLGLKHTSLILLLWLSVSFVYFEYSAGQIYRVNREISGYIPIIYEGMYFHFCVNRAHVMQVSMNVLSVETKEFLMAYSVLAKSKGSFEQEKFQYTVYHHLWRDKNFHLQQTCTKKAYNTCISKFFGLKPTSQMLMVKGVFLFRL